MAELFDTRLTIRLDHELSQQLDAVAARDGLSRAEVVRTALRTGLATPELLSHSTGREGRSPKRAPTIRLAIKTGTRATRNGPKRRS